MRLRPTLALAALAVLAALVLAAPPTAAQRPGVDMLSLLDMPFRPGPGGFSAGVDRHPFTATVASRA